MAMIKIFLVEDHAILRHGIKAILKEHNILIE
jgi:DNA-binding NarL/FixJ family response regulator